MIFLPSQVGTDSEIFIFMTEYPVLIVPFPRPLLMSFIIMNIIPHVNQAFFFLLFLRFSLNKFFLIYRLTEHFTKATQSFFVPNFICSPSALLVSVRESEPERNLNPSANTSQNIKLIDAPGCVSIGKIKILASYFILFPHV